MHAEYIWFYVQMHGKDKSSILGHEIIFTSTSKNDLYLFFESNFLCNFVALKISVNRVSFYSGLLRSMHKNKIKNIT